LSDLASEVGSLLTWKAFACSALPKSKTNYLNHPDKALEAAEKALRWASCQTTCLRIKNDDLLQAKKNIPMRSKSGRILPNWPINVKVAKSTAFVCQRAGNAAGQIPD